MLPPRRNTFPCNGYRYESVPTAGSGRNTNSEEYRQVLSVSARIRSGVFVGKLNASV